MASKCQKCAVEIASGDVTATCVKCKLVYHPACTRVGSVQNFTKSQIKAWKCDSCYSESTSVKTSEEPSEDNKSILAAIKILKKDIYTKFDEKIDTVQLSIDTLTTSLNKLTERIDKSEESQAKISDQCNRLEEDQDRTNAEVRALKLQIQDMEQHSRCANVEIQGIPLSQNENIYDVLQNIAKAINVPFSNNDFSLAHRLRLFSKKHSHPPIIAQFQSRRTKEVWLRAVRSKKGLQAKEVHPAFENTAVYINEQLTAHNKQLLGRARRMVREGKLHSARFTNGKVLIQTRDGGATTRVISQDDIDKLDTA